MPRSAPPSIVSVLARTVQPHTGAGLMEDGERYGMVPPEERIAAATPTTAG